VRTIRIDAETVDRLNDWKAQQAAMRIRAGFVWASDDQDVIANTAFGTAINQRNVHRSLATATRVSQRMECFARPPSDRG
jgi:hypothetical protein